MSKILVIAALVFYASGLDSAEDIGFSQLDGRARAFISKQHAELRSFVVLRPESGDDTKSSGKSSADRSAGSENTLGAFRLLVCKEGGQTETLTPQKDVLYTSRALHSENNEDVFLPCLDQMEEHWKQCCPERGERVLGAATVVVSKLVNEVKRAVEASAGELEQSPNSEKLNLLIEMQRKFCAAEKNEQWQDAVRFLEGESLQSNVRTVVSMKDVDMNNLKKMELTELRDDHQMGGKVKSHVSTIVKHGWHAEQRMLFKAREILGKQNHLAPERVVMCLYTDNAPCHSFDEVGKESQDKNQCRCRQTLDILSQKRSLGEAFNLSRNHPWNQVLFTLTVSFSYRYDMDSVLDDDKNNFGKWLFHLSNQGEMKSWTECPQSKKDVRATTKQSEEDQKQSDVGGSKKVKQVKMQDNSKLSVNVEEIKRIHDYIVVNKCECSSPVNQWKHVNDILKDMGKDLQLP